MINVGHSPATIGYVASNCPLSHQRSVFADLAATAGVGEGLYYGLQCSGCVCIGLWVFKGSLGVNRVQGFGLIGLMGFQMLGFRDEGLWGIPSCSLQASVCFGAAMTASAIRRVGFGT